MGNPMSTAGNGRHPFGRARGMPVRLTSNGPTALPGLRAGRIRPARPTRRPCGKPQCRRDTRGAVRRVGAGFRFAERSPRRPSWARLCQLSGGRSGGSRWPLAEARLAQARGTGSAGYSSARTGSTGAGPAGTGSAGCGSPRTSSAGTGSPRASSAGSGSAGSGSAGTGSVRTSSIGVGSTDIGRACRSRLGRISLEDRGGDRRQRRFRLLFEGDEACSRHGDSVPK